MNLFKIDGQEYDLDQMNDELKAQITSFQAAEAKLLELRRDTALVMTARSVYLRMLKKNLAEKGSVSSSVMARSEKGKSKK